MKHVLLFALLLSACTAPTLAQRQDNWRLYRDSVRATCLIGMTSDKAMPTDVEGWCMEAIGP